MSDRLRTESSKTREHEKSNRCIFLRYGYHRERSPAACTNNHSRSTLEMKNPKSRPAIKTPEKSLDAYDVVFLGYPIWWDLAPTVVNTFIESQHLDGKVVVPFATSGGSGINHSAVQLKKQYPNIKWREGKLLNAPSDEELAQELGRCPILSDNLQW